MTTDQKVKRVIQLDKKMKSLQEHKALIYRCGLANNGKGYKPEDDTIYMQILKKIERVESEMAELLPEDQS